MYLFFRDFLILVAVILISTCQFIQNVIRDACPTLPKCRCNKELTSVDCSYGNFTAIPDIPETTVHVKLDHNSLASIPTRAFSKLSTLQSLILNNNRISDIEPFAFEGLVNLTKLELSENKIQTLGHKCFANIPRLQHLNLKSNWLNYSTNDAFYGTSELISVNLNGNQFDSVPILGYQPRLEKLVLASNLIKNATFPLSYLNCSESLYINLANNRRMTHLDNDTFRSLAGVSITGITLAGNNINTVMPGTFEVFQSVKALSLRNNPLSITSLKNVADGLRKKKLSRIDLSGVFGSDDEFQIGMSLFSFSTIQELLLDRNSISLLPNNTLKDFRNVWFLSLLNNELSELGEESLKGLFNLLQIDLRHNGFISFPKYLPNYLEIINLQGNKIKLIDTNDTIHLFKLKRLFLRHNQVERIKLGAFKGLANLELLDLAQNEIAIFPGDIFKPLRNLTYLDLSNNNLRKIYLHKRHLKSLVSLLHLDMSGNDCVYLREDMFEPMTSLKYLHQITSRHHRRKLIQRFEGA